MRERLSSFAPLLVVLLGLLWLNAGGLTGSRPISAYHDNLDGAHPIRLEAARQWREGHLPLWNPYKRLGAPLLGDPTVGALYPGNLPYLFGDGLPRYQQLERVAVLHALLAALTMFFFLRTLELGPTAAAMGALVYAANGLTLWLAARYIQMQNSLVWLPLVLACLHRAACCRRGLGWMVAGGLAVALQFLAGYPEYSFYSGLIAGGYALALALRGPASSRSFRPLLAVAAIFAIGMALAAVQLVPAIELQLLARRPGTLSLKAFQSFAASPKMLLDWMVPGYASRVFVVPAATTYVGMLAVAFAVEGLRRRDFLRWFLVVSLVVGFLLSVGSATPFSAWAYHVPGLSAFRHPFKHLFELMFALSVLGAVGADRFVRSERGAVAVVNGAALATLALIVALSFFSFWEGPDFWGGTGLFAPTAAELTNTRIAWVLAGGGIALFLLCQLWWRPRVALFLALLLLCPTYAANRATMLNADWEGLDRQLTQPETARLMEAEGRVLIVRQGFGQKRKPEYLLGDFPTEFRVMAVHGAGPFLWKPLGDFTSMLEEEVLRKSRVLSGEDPLLDLIGCRYVITTRDGKGGFRHEGWLQEPWYRVLRKTDDYLLVERRGAYPMLRFVDRVRCTQDETTATLVHGTSLFDFAKTALVACGAGERPPRGALARADARVEETESRAGRRVFRTTVPEGQSGFLVISQADIPGWRARIDGDAVPIYRSYGLLQGVVVPGGEHSLLLEYRPTSVVVGAWVSALTVLVIVSLLIADRRRGVAREPRRGESGS